MNRKEIFLKNIKKGTIFLILGLFFILISLVFVLSLYIENKNQLKEAKNIKEAKVSDLYAKIDAQIMTDYFATNDYAGIQHKSYFIWDKEDVYIVDLNEENRNRLEDIYNFSYSVEENIEKPASVEIKGMTKKIPDDLKKIAIAAMNEIIGEDVVNMANFNQNFGTVYLDTFASPLTTFLSNLLICLPTLLIGIFFITHFITKKRKIKKYKQKLGNTWEKLIEELDRPDTIYFKQLKLFLTNHYIIETLNDLEIYSYQDIVWIYPHEYHYHGMLSQKSIYFLTKDTKTHKIAEIVASKKNLKFYDEIYNTLVKRIPNVLSGYTKENEEKAKKINQKM